MRCFLPLCHTSLNRSNDVTSDAPKGMSRYHGSARRSSPSYSRSTHADGRRGDQVVTVGMASAKCLPSRLHDIRLSCTIVKVKGAILPQIWETTANHDRNFYDCLSSRR